MKIQSKNFKTISIQIVVFAQPNSHISQSRFLTPILSNYQNIFDGDITAVPVPADAPAEIPRAIITSKNGAWTIQGAPARIDCFWTSINNAEMEDSTLSKALEVVMSIIESSKFSVGRCAFLLNRILDTSTPAPDLANHFCNQPILQGPIKQSDNFELHNHKKYWLPLTNSRMHINSWVRCKTALSIASQKPAILVEQDLNTLQEEIEKRPLDSGVLKDFFLAADKEMKGILDLYFPD